MCYYFWQLLRLIGSHFRIESHRSEVPFPWGRGISRFSALFTCWDLIQPSIYNLSQGLDRKKEKHGFSFSKRILLIGRTNPLNYSNADIVLCMTDSIWMSRRKWPANYIRWILKLTTISSHLILIVRNLFPLQLKAGCFFSWIKIVFY